MEGELDISGDTPIQTPQSTVTLESQAMPEPQSTSVDTAVHVTTGHDGVPTINSHATDSMETPTELSLRARISSLETRLMVEKNENASLKNENASLYSLVQSSSSLEVADMREQRAKEVAASLIQVRELEEELLKRVEAKEKENETIRKVVAQEKKENAELVKSNRHLIEEAQALRSECSRQVDELQRAKDVITGLEYDKENRNHELKGYEHRERVICQELKSKEKELMSKEKEIDQFICSLWAKMDSLKAKSEHIELKDEEKDAEVARLKIKANSTWFEKEGLKARLWAIEDAVYRKDSGSNRPHKRPRTAIRFRTWPIVNGSDMARDMDVRAHLEFYGLHTGARLGAQCIYRPSRDILGMSLQTAIRKVQ
ncbi:hypothetical protein BU16DRAFT_534584 [Lophium mytilinum]|uniref:Uncharacterized protein n=1 Tax=Lophium mytilinum TaxID=390894 RepID=A0A6A6R7V9_9PEZI|nr:hypothetical protein BU16DRAFT_534584 [Lophium mytilinum]